MSFSEACKLRNSEMIGVTVEDTRNLTGDARAKVPIVNPNIPMLFNLDNGTKDRIAFERTKLAPKNPRLIP